jgi:hypothetical protein
MEMIDRREALKKTAWIMGAAVSASTVAAFLQSCKSAPDLNYKPVFFKEDQAKIVSELAEIIIPKTDTPGAKDVCVPNFIDRMLKDCYKEEDQKSFLEGLAKFDADAKAAYGDSFIYLKDDQKLEYVKKANEAAVAEVKKDPTAKRPFILMAKELTMLGFFTSEPGATQVLQYLPVPGSYKGCIPLSEAGNGKTWAT